MRPQERGEVNRDTTDLVPFRKKYRNPGRNEAGPGKGQKGLRQRGVNLKEMGRRL